MAKKTFQILVFSAAALALTPSESKSKPKCADIQKKCFDTIMSCWQPVWNRCYKGSATDECANQTDVKKFSLECQRWFMVECSGSKDCGGDSYKQKICSQFGDSNSKAYKQCETDWSNNSTPQILCLYAATSMEKYDHACE
jgi:hypothetical protein